MVNNNEFCMEFQSVPADLSSPLVAPVAPVRYPSHVSLPWHSTDVAYLWFSNPVGIDWTSMSDALLASFPTIVGCNNVAPISTCQSELTPSCPCCSAVALDPCCPPMTNQYLKSQPPHFLQKDFLGITDREIFSH